VTYLLDVNLLLALFDSAHQHHEPAHLWFGQVGRHSWATCPITENGFTRVISNPAYANSPISPELAVEKLRIFCQQPAHVFWPDMCSLRDVAIFDVSRLRGHQQITDLYLVGLAAKNGGKLATFDGRIPVAGLTASTATAVEMIPTR